MITDVRVVKANEYARWYIRAYGRPMVITEAHETVFKQIGIDMSLFIVSRQIPEGK